MIIGYRYAAIVTLSVIALAGCTQQAPPAADTAADVAAIHDISAAWEKAYNAGDADGVAALYAEDAVLLPPGAPAISGNAGIREYWAKDAAATKEAGYAVQLQPGDVGVAGDTAWESGAWTVTDQSGTQVDAGKDVLVYRKKDGKWLMIRDIWNSDKPAAPAAPEGAPAAP